jgi:nucleoside-diphosphate-sugar epimerase
MEKIILTGASGLTGTHIAEYFSARGVKLNCLVRRSSNINFLKTLDVEIVYADLNNPEELKEAFQGADFIIHTAAKVSDWGRYEDFYHTNVVGTLNVIEAARFNGIKNIITTGSISCDGEESSPVVKNEEMEYNSHYNYFLDKIFPSGMNYYRDTKAEMNERAIQFCCENGINLTIIEPAWIYGEREFHSGFYDFLKTMKSGLPLTPGSRKNKFHTIYARDLAKIYYLAYQKKLDGINKILAVAPIAEVQFHLLDLFCLKAGYRRPKRIPKFLIYPPAFLTEVIYTTFRIKVAPPISRARVNIFYDNIEYSGKKAMDLLGFEPDYSLEEGIEKTVRWYKDNNLL